MRWLLPTLLLTLIWGAALEAAETPRIELDQERRLVLTSLPPILAEEGVEEHLTTGLTTSIYFRPDGKSLGAGAKNTPLGGARVDIRYDLWDEVFHTTALGSAGGAQTEHGSERIQRAEMSSFTDLLEWWQDLRLVLLDGDRLEQPWPRRLKIIADVVPFSAAEQDDARRWLSESIEEGRRSGTAEVGRSGEPSAETLSRTFNLLLATSIRRRALASFPWTVSLPIDAPGGTP